MESIFDTLVKAKQQNLDTENWLRSLTNEQLENLGDYENGSQNLQQDILSCVLLLRFLEFNDEQQIEATPSEIMQWVTILGAHASLQLFNRLNLIEFTTNQSNLWYFTKGELAIKAQGDFLKQLRK